MGKINIKITREKDDERTSTPIKCTIEQDGLSFGFYFREGTTTAQMAKAIRHKLLYLGEDLALEVPANERAGIIRLHEQAAEMLSTGGPERTG